VSEKEREMADTILFSTLAVCEKSANGVHHPMDKGQLIQLFKNYHWDAWNRGPKIDLETLNDDKKACRFCGEIV
jgi:hypothetical protein